MTELTRRTVLYRRDGGKRRCRRSIHCHEPCACAAPPAGKQAPGVYRYKVGEFECTSVSDGARTFPMPDGFVRNVPKDQALAAAEAAYMPKGMVTVPFNPQLINTGSKLVLIDTGFGPTPNAPVGLLTANMAVAGIDPKAVDIVVISHLHPDHTTASRMPRAACCFRMPRSRCRRSTGRSG